MFLGCSPCCACPIYNVDPMTTIRDRIANFYMDLSISFSISAFSLHFRSWPAVSVSGLSYQGTFYKESGAYADWLDTLRVENLYTYTNQYGDTVGRGAAIQPMVPAIDNDGYSVGMGLIFSAFGASIPAFLPPTFGVSVFPCGLTPDGNPSRGVGSGGVGSSGIILYQDRRTFDVVVGGRRAWTGGYPSYSSETFSITAGDVSGSWLLTGNTNWIDLTADRFTGAPRKTSTVADGITPITFTHDVSDIVVYDGYNSDTVSTSVSVTWNQLDIIWGDGAQESAIPWFTDSLQANNA